jgi:hypothetical protein
MPQSNLLYKQWDRTPPVYWPVDGTCLLYHAYWDGTATDHSIYGNDGNVIGGTFVANGLSLDGIDDYIRVPHDSTLEYTGGAGSYVFWATLDLPAGPKVWIHKVNGGLAHYGVFNHDAIGKMHCNLGGFDSTSDINYLVNGTPYLYSITRDAIANCNYWRNGVIFSTPIAAGLNFGTSTSDLYLFSLGGTGYFAKVVVHEFLMFNSDFSASMADYFNFTKARYGL